MATPPTLPRPATPSEEITGRIDFSSDVDFFSFDAIAGAAFNFSFTDSPSIWVDLRVYDTDGTTELAEAVPEYPRLLSWRAPSTGTYFVKVGDFDNNNIGTYSLSIDQAMDDHGNDVCGCDRS